MNKHLTTDMADANGLQRAIRPTGFFNIKKMAADFCCTHCIMDNTGSLNNLWTLWTGMKQEKEEYQKGYQKYKEVHRVPPGKRKARV